MNRILINNLRSLAMTEPIELKPLTMCVGRNSSGKSTFIRIFPLLKQSLEVKISEPLLWYGAYVDFGSFQESLNRKTNKNEIILAFEFETKLQDGIRGLRRGIRFADGSIIKVELTITEKFISRMDFDIADQNICIDIDLTGKIKGIVVNGYQAYDHKRRKVVIDSFNEDGNLLPKILAYNENEDRYLNRITFLRDQIVDEFLNKSYKNTKRETIVEFVERIVFSNKTNTLKMIKNYNAPETLRKELENLELTSDWFLYINNLIVAYRLPELLDSINYLLTDELMSVKYIKPIRAMIDRYYRIQGLSTDELDSAGANLPMLFSNMSKQEKADFKTWSHDKFGITFSVQNHEGHVSLFLEEETGESYNLADVGYGYSQVIPIIMQIWLVFQEKKNRLKSIRRTKKILLIIEQPELHLHPAFQAKIVDVFASILKEAKEVGFDLKIIIETHSETMINRSGYLIMKKYLQPQDVNVLIFDKNNGKTTISEKNYNQQGILEEWPLGFFSPERRI